MDKTSGNAKPINDSPFQQCVFTASLLKLGPSMAKNVTDLTNRPASETDEKIYRIVKAANGRVSPSTTQVSNMISNFKEIMNSCRGMNPSRSCSPVQSS